MTQCTLCQGSGLIRVKHGGVRRCFVCKPEPPKAKTDWRDVLLDALLGAAVYGLLLLAMCTVVP